MIWHAIYFHFFFPGKLESEYMISKYLKYSAVESYNQGKRKGREGTGQEKKKENKAGFWAHKWESFLVANWVISIFFPLD